MKTNFFNVGHSKNMKPSAGDMISPNVMQPTHHNNMSVCIQQGNIVFRVLNACQKKFKHWIFEKTRKCWFFHVSNALHCISSIHDLKIGKHFFNIQIILRKSTHGRTLGSCAGWTTLRWAAVVRSKVEEGIFLFVCFLALNVN
jgi:hypothetical protein